jgi:hypothetical protein
VKEPALDSWAPFFGVSSVIDGACAGGIAFVGGTAEIIKDGDDLAVAGAGAAEMLNVGELVTLLALLAGVATGFTIAEFAWI